MTMMKKSFPVIMTAHSMQKSTTGQQNRGSMFCFNMLVQVGTVLSRASAHGRLQLTLEKNYGWALTQRSTIWCMLAFQDIGSEISDPFTAI